MARLSVEEFPQDLRRAYDVVCPLGSGSFGEVYRARARPPKPPGFPTDVAIKLIRVPADGLDRQLQIELINHFKCFSPQIVSALDIVFVPGRVAIVMELVPGGDMFRLVNRSRQYLEEDKVRWIFQQVVLGVFYLHELNIAQRDIKLENVLVMDPRSEWPRVKITDFGFSKDSERSRCESRVGTFNYMSPEVFLGRTLVPHYDGKKADIWSCGVMLYVMLFSRYPFNLGPSGEQYGREVQRMCRGHYELPSRPHISDPCQDLLRRLITSDPDERFSAEQCLSHPWFQQNLPVNAVEETHIYLRRTEERWSSGRRRLFERKMRRRADGSSLSGFWSRMIST